MALVSFLLGCGRDVIIVTVVILPYNLWTLGRIRRILHQLIKNQSSISGRILYGSWNRLFGKAQTHIKGLAFSTTGLLVSVSHPGTRKRSIKIYRQHPLIDLYPDHHLPSSAWASSRENDFKRLTSTNINWSSRKDAIFRDLPSLFPTWNGFSTCVSTYYVGFCGSGKQFPKKFNILS